MIVIQATCFLLILNQLVMVVLIVMIDMNLSDLDLDMQDDFSDRSLDSSSDDENDPQATASSLGALAIQPIKVDGEFWTDVLEDVDIDPFIEMTGTVCVIL